MQQSKLYHLPPADAGTEYRHRVIDGQEYTTTGTFPVSAPNGKRPHLHRAGCLILDVDLCDYVLATAYPPTAVKPTKDVVKSFLWNLTQDDLDTRINTLALYVCQLFRSVLGVYPTYTISSGYGVHCYAWLMAGQGYGSDTSVALSANVALIEKVNTLAGFTLADPSVHDTGTRVLRVPGSANRKGPTPRTVKPLFADPAACLDLSSIVGPGRPLEAPGYRAPVPPSGIPPAPAPQEPPGAAHVPPPPVTTGGSFGALYQDTEQSALSAILDMVQTCPFFLWLQEHPTQVRYQSWRGAATNLAAIGGELGRQAFHELSRLDTNRYNLVTTDRAFDDAMKSVQSHGPMTYTQLASNGDWPGPIPADVKAPASKRFRKTQIEGVVINPKTGEPRRTPGNLRKILRNHSNYGKRLRFNEMRMCVELDNTAIDDNFYGMMQETLEDELDVSFPKQWVIDSVREIAAETTYHPVKEYLEQLTWDGTSRIGQVLTEVLGADATEINLTYVQSFLVSAVARALCEDPAGVKVDTVLILKGEQGIKKSTFFQTLAGPFFSDTQVDLRNKDSFLALRGTWLLEWQEFEHTLGRTAIAVVKQFLSSRVDTYRPPYGREQITQARRCVIVGTTNEDHFLFDSTGSRRFWIIDVNRVNIETLRRIRNQVWAEAVYLFKQGCPWWLDSDAERERELLASKYAEEEPWEVLVNKWLCDNNITDVSADEVLIRCIQKEHKDIKKSDQQTIAIILRKAGFVRSRIQNKAVREYRWMRGPGNVVELRPHTPPTLTLVPTPAQSTGNINRLFNGKV